MLPDRDRPLYEIKANLFKGLAHPYRIRILEILAAALSTDGAGSAQPSDTPTGQIGEVSVSVILDETGLEASHLSQHLAVLRRHRLVRSQRRGSMVYYRLAYPEVSDLLRVARTLLGEILTETKIHLDVAAGAR